MASILIFENSLLRFLVISRQSSELSARTTFPKKEGENTRSVEAESTRVGCDVT